MSMNRKEKVGLDFWPFETKDGDRNPIMKGMLDQHVGCNKVHSVSQVRAQYIVPIMR